MKKYFILTIITILFFGGIPVNQLSVLANSKITISIDGLNVREGPGLSYRVVKQVKKGESFQLIKEEKDWLQIKLSQTQTGWVANWLVQKQGSTNPDIKGTPTIGKITVDGLRVRTGPGLNFQTVGHLSKGVQVMIVEQNENWTKISTQSMEGWVSSDYVAKENGQASTSSPSNTNNVTYASIQVDSLNVRKEASLQSEVIGKLSKGQKVEVLSSDKNWVQILMNGKHAWVSSQYVQLETQPVTGEQIEIPPVSSNGGVGKVTANALNVRSEPDLSGDVIGMVQKGQSYTIHEEKNNWSKIELESKKFGWVNTWYLEKQAPSDSQPESKEVKDSLVVILHDGTNIRSGPTVQTTVVHRANAGEEFPIVAIKGDWYEIELNNGSSGYIAGWIVSTTGDVQQVEKPGAEAHLKNKTIILDPGHGGGDNGTTGARGTLEKQLTLRTAKLLYDKLRASGATVILTRSNDSYFSLRSRVSTAHYHNADAFISIHYDSILDRSVSGMTSYYYHSYQKPLAQTIHNATIGEAGIKNRGARFGDYHVLRENKQKAILLELGYLSNPTEETMVTTPQYQESVATGIFNGLAKYFKSN